MRRLSAVLAVALVTSVAGAATANATVTTTNITDPADGSMYLWNTAVAAPQDLTVSGTSDGTSGDAVDLFCEQNGGLVGAPYQGSGIGFPVNADGTFSATVPLSTFPPGPCELVAVPHGARPYPPAGFSGPRVSISAFLLNSSFGPGFGPGFLFVDATTTALTGGFSIGCGPGTFLYDPSLAPGQYLIRCSGSLRSSRYDYGSPAGFDLTRSGVLVDGHNAYSAAAAWALNKSNPGIPGLTASLDAFNPSTGDAQTTESEAIVRCDPNDVFDPSPADCSSFVNTGVRVQRITNYTDSGHVATVTDVYTGTDGASHTLDLEYETDLGGPAAGWELPSESLFTQRSTGATGPGATSAPGTIYAIYNAADVPSFTNPVAAMTFATAYNSVAFDNTLAYPSSALFDYQRTVPAGGSVTIQWSYATESSLGVVQADAAAARDALSPPTIAISSPGNGAVLATTPVTVRGTAAAATGVQRVTVNGVTATVAGGAFAADVPLTLGANTLTAEVTSNTGATTTASATVSYTGPGPVASTGRASNVGSSTAKVPGTIVPGATAGTYYFQYGKTTSYGHQTAATPFAAGAGGISVDAKLSRLTAHAGYHYRLVATNRGGTSYGSDHAFTTLYALRGMTLEVHRTGARRYHLSGRLKTPTGLTRHRACSGTVRIVAEHGGHAVVTRRVRVSRRCTYAASLSVRVHGPGKLRIAATFTGSSLIGPFTTRGVTALFG